MTVVAIVTIVVFALVLLNGLRNNRRFEERYPLAAALRREAAELELGRSADASGSEPQDSAPNPGVTYQEAT